MSKHNAEFVEPEWFKNDSMNYFVEAVNGKKIDVSPWMEKLKQNKLFNLEWHQRSPLVVNMHGEFFWMMDYDDWIPLNQESVNNLKKLIDTTRIIW